MTVITALVFGAALSAVLLFSLLASSPRIGWSTTATTVPGGGPTPYPVGVANPHEPSGLAPPGVAALAGYTRSYTTDFPGRTLPSGWLPFTGVPGGDPGGHFAANHVAVHDGLLQLSTWRDKNFGMHWVTGGLCQCGLAKTYGAYLVRSRITGAGPNESQLLWPASNTWPPEIDFNETGPTDISTSWTVHWGQQDNFAQQTLHINVTQWHTWGVVWTPHRITFLVDGRQWGSIDVQGSVPTQAMTLDLQQRAGCGTGFVCPTKPRSMLVDWVAEYTHNS